MSHRFTKSFTAQADHIDVNGHVNNAVYVRWMEELASDHWFADAPPEHVNAYAWVVTRHEIDYRGNVKEGETVKALTEIREGPKGARFNRYFTFTDEADRVLVRAKTSWAMVDRASFKVLRIPAEVTKAFVPQGGGSS